MKWSMGKITILAFATAMDLLSLDARADCASDACTQVYIEMLYVEGQSTSTWIQTSGTEANLSCAPDSGVFLQVEDQSSKKELMALLMMAYSLDKPISVRLYNGPRGCAIAYAYVVR